MERLERFKDLVDRATVLTANERQDFLVANCGDDSELRAEVEDLLSMHSEPALWPEGPLVVEPVPAMVADRLSPGQIVGSYRIVAPLGSGGMGLVALASRITDFEKEVAIKVIRGPLTKRSIRRFERERQILATLDHPGMARLLDGGRLESGRPWLAMEFVAGQPIDSYCDAHELDVANRVALIIAVCEAMSAAHRIGIVHRDLKPSNVLVTADGQVKLIDFGIAKDLASDASELTGPNHQPMTVRWAAPEQVTGEPVSSSTDIHAIGLLLDYLLVGKPLHQGLSRQATMMAVAMQRPSRPSQRADSPRAQALTGNLDRIVLRALAKEPGERYASVDDLAADLQRHLAGQPVGRGSGHPLRDAWDSIRHGSRRNGLFITAVVLMLAGLLFGAVMAVMKVEADAARRRAEQAQAQQIEAREQAEATLRYLQDLLWTSNPDESEGSFIQWVQKAEEKLGEYDDPIIRARLLSMIGRANSETGRFDAAIDSWQKALALVRAAPDASGSDRAIALNNLASGFFMTGDYRQASDLYTEALAMKEELAPDDIDLALALANLASANMRVGNLDQVEGLYRETLDIRLNEAEPKVGEIGNSYRGLAAYYLETDHYAESETASREALRYLYEASEGKPTTRIASVGTGLGRALHGQGDAAAALEEYDQAMAIRVDRFGSDHLHVTSSHLDQARALIDLERYSEAMKHLGAAGIWLGRQPSRRWGSFRARAQVLGGVLAMRQGSCAASIREALAGGYESLTAGRERPDHYGRRAAAWLAEFDAACPSIQIEKSLAIDG